MNNFVEIKSIKESFKKEYTYQLEGYKRELLKVNKDNNEELIRYYTLKITKLLQIISDLDNEINYMRSNDKDDLELRNKIKKDYSKIVKEAVPDYAYVAFFGINNLSKIQKIIDTGLVNLNEINITYKDNIRVSLEDADNSATSYLPYGAIFAFKPYDIQNSDGILNIKDTKDKLYGIITTKENIEKIQNWCLQYGIDVSKVFTHKEFISKCENLLKNQIYKHSKMQF